MRSPSARALRRMLNFYPPLCFAGIRVLEIADDWRYARVVLRRRWYNRNYVGTQFGGSLFAMTDPFWMILTLRCLGGDYIVWDKAAEIEFTAPGRTDVFAQFRNNDSMLDEIRAATAGGGGGGVTGVTGGRRVGGVVGVLPGGGATFLTGVEVVGVLVVVVLVAVTWSRAT